MTLRAKPEQTCCMVNYHFPEYESYSGKEIIKVRKVLAINLNTVLIFEHQLGFLNFMDIKYSLHFRIDML